MFLKNILTASLVCGLAIALSGCGSTKVQDKAQTRQYDITESRAKNIGEVFSIQAIKDTEIPEGVNVNDSVLINGSINSGLLHWGSHFGTGAGGFSSLGLGFGMAFIDSFLRGAPFEARDGYFGYVPMSRSTNNEKAATLFLDQFVNATLKASKELGIDKKYEVSIEDAYLAFDSDSYAGKRIWFVNDKLGCPKYKEKQSCMIRVYVSFPETQTIISPVIAGDEMIPAWKMESIDVARASLGYDSLQLYRGKDNVFPYDKHELYSVIAKHLPKYAYIYAASIKNDEGNRIPPVIYEKNKTLFFVKPKK